MTFEDDWLRSGDLAYYEEMGNIFLDRQLSLKMSYAVVLFEYVYSVIIILNF